MNRFDGHSFKVFTAEEHNLASNDFSHALEDPNGLMWLISRNALNQDGLAYYSQRIDIIDPVTEEVFDVEDMVSLPFSIDEMVFITSDAHSNLWFSTKGGEIYKYDGSSIEIVVQRPVSKNWPGHFVITNDDILAFIERKKIAFYTAGGQSISEVEIPYQWHVYTSDSNGGIWANNIRTQPQDSGFVKIWRASTQGLYALHLKEKNGAKLEVPAAQLLYIQGTASKGFYGYIGDRFMLFDSTGRVYHDFTESLKPYRINPTEIHLSRDRDGVCWLGTPTGAIALHARVNPFRNHSVPDYVGNSHPLDEDALRLTQLQQILKRQTSNTLTISEKDFTTSLKDTSGLVWLGDQYGGIHKYDPDIPSLLTLREPVKDQDIEIYNRRAIRSFLPIDQYNLLVGTDNGGLHVFNIEKRAFQRDLLEPTPTGNEVIVNHMITSDEGIWGASNKGIVRISQLTNEIKVFDQSNSTLPCRDINYIYEDGDVFWLGTSGCGLVKWNKSDDTFKQYTTSTHGLSNMSILAIFEDDASGLWMPSHYGLMRFDKATESIEVWLEQHGLPSVEFTSYAHHKGREGTLFLNTTAGLISFSPEELTSDYNNGSDELEITGYYEINNNTGAYQSMLQSILPDKTITLSPPGRSIVIDVASLDYRDLNMSDFAYQLEGLENIWHHQKSNSIRLNSLPYGAYNLKIKNSSNSNIEELVIPIFVKRPIYLRFWFIIGLLILTLSVLFALYKYRTLQLKREQLKLQREVKKRTKTINEQKEQLQIANDAKDRLFSVIGHDLRGPLFSLQGIDEQIQYLLSTGQMDRLKKIGKGIDESTFYISETLSNLLSWSRHQMGSLPYLPTRVQLENSIDETLGLFYRSAQEKEIKITTDVAPEISVYMDKNALQIILRNLLSNAIKFTKKGGNIKICARSTDRAVQLKIIDNGIGLSLKQSAQFESGMTLERRPGTQGEKSSGLGLMLVKDLVKQNKGLISMKSEVNDGTTFELTLPIRTL